MGEKLYTVTYLMLRMENCPHTIRAYHSIMNPRHRPVLQCIQVVADLWIVTRQFSAKSPMSLACIAEIETGLTGTQKTVIDK